MILRTMIFLLFLTMSLNAGSIYQNTTYDHLFIKYGKYYNVNPIILKTIAIIESSLNPEAINRNSNKSVDVGIMQINTYWHDKLPETIESKEVLLKNPEYSIAVAAWIVSKNTVNRYDWKTVGNYHSINSKHRDKWLSRFKKTLTKLREVDVNKRLEMGYF